MNESQKYLARLIAEGNQHKTAAEAILDRTLIEGRSPNDEEKQEIQGHLEKAADVKARIDTEKEQLAFRKQLEEMGVGDPINSDAPVAPENMPAHKGMSIGELFIRSGVFRALKGAKTDGRLPEAFRTQSVRLPYDYRQHKAASSPLLESNAESLYGDGSSAGPISTVVPGVFQPGFLQLRPTIADLLPVIPITQGNTAVWRVLKDTNRPGSGDEPIPEGQAKAKIEYEFDVESAQLEKYAAFTEISEEYLEDDATVAAFINADLPLQIRQVEEDKLAAALYDSVSDATSLPGATTLFDEVLAAMTEIEAAGGTPTGMIITPTDWATLRIAKFGTGAGDLGYVGGGPFSATRNPWDLTVVISRAATPQHPLVGDFTQGAKLFRKGSLGVSATNSNRDNFENNLVTIRAEMREKLGKQYPEFFKSADLT